MIQAEEMCLQSGPECIRDCYSISIVSLVVVSSRQKGQNERRHDHLSSCIYIVEVLGDGCQHWNEEVEQENRDEGYQRDKRK